MELEHLSYIHSFYFYSASSSPLLLRGAPNTAWILCRNFTSKRHHRQLWVKDLPKVPTWRLERESNPWPFGRKASTLPNMPPRPTIRLWSCSQIISDHLLLSVYSLINYLILPVFDKNLHQPLSAMAQTYKSWCCDIHINQVICHRNQQQGYIMKN